MIWNLASFRALVLPLCIYPFQYPIPVHRIDMLGASYLDFVPRM